MESIDEERFRVRDALLDLAHAKFSEAVDRCLRRMPLDEIAGFIVGDEKVVRIVTAGSREKIAAELRERFPSKGTDQIAALLADKEPGFVPCAFVVRLKDDWIDVSVVAMRMERVH